MRIASGVTDQYIYFVAVDSTDLKTRETGLTSFTVYRSRNGGAAAAYTTPTINETSAANMPGVYELLLDEDMTIDSGDETQEVALHITHAGMAPVTRTFELYRPKITAGNTLGVAADGDLLEVNTLTSHTAQTGDSFARIGATGSGLTSLAPASTALSTATWTAARAGYLDNINNSALQTTAAQTGDSFARLGAPAGASVSADVAAVKVDTAAILVDTADMQPKLGTISDLGGGATVGANLSDMAGATFSTTTDSLEAIRDRGDAAWTTGAGGSDRLLMVDTTIATLASQTSFTLTAGSADDNAYVNCTIVIEDASTSTQKAVGLISAYTGATKTVTLKYDPAIFTMAVSDKVYILAENSLKSTAQNRQLDVTATGAAGVDWGNVENPTTTVGLTGTTVGTVTAVTNQVTANATAISGDATAADNLEAMLDGTGGVALTLNQLRIAAANANGGIYITNSLGDGIHSEATGGNGHGADFQGNGTGAGLNGRGGITDGPGIQGTGRGAGGGIYGQNTTGSGHGGHFVGGTSDGHGIGSFGQGAGDGIYAAGDLTGDGFEAVKGAISGYDINADIQGNLSGSVGSVAAGGITAASIATDAVDADALAADAVTEISNGIAALVIETGYTLKQALQIIAAATGGKLSGAATATNTIRSLDDTADRITATVDSDGNRSAVTHNV